METFIVREVNRGHFIVELKNGHLADSSCVDEILAPAQFKKINAERIAEQFCVDSNGFYSKWEAFPSDSNVEDCS